MLVPPMKAAFSLVELLVVIAVIAIVAAVAIPNMASITQSADEAARLRNAQNVVSAYTAFLSYYQAANGSVPDPYTTKEDAVNALISSTGLSVTNQKLDTTNFFRVPVPGTNDIAMDHLVMTNGQLIMTTPQ